MELNGLKKMFGIALMSMVAVNGMAQDVIARQAPSDRRLRDVTSIKINNVITPVDLENPAAEIYTDWNNAGVASAAGKMPDNFKVDLRGFSMPTPSRKVTSKFGRRWGRLHAGLDIKVYTGDTIYAAFDGKARIVKYNAKGYGYYVVLRHPNGLETLYGHLSKQLIKENQVVRAGEPIGLGGNTGRSFGSHLHFETRILGKPINPALMFDFVNQDVTGDFYVVNSGRVENKHTGFVPNTALAQAETETQPVAEADVETEASKLVASVASTTATSAKKTTSTKNAATKAKTYRVKNGDTLYDIARKHGITVDKLCKLNGLNQNTVIHAGKVLKCS